MARARMTRFVRRRRFAFGCGLARRFSDSRRRAFVEAARLWGLGTVHDGSDPTAA